MPALSMRAVVSGLSVSLVVIVVAVTFTATYFAGLAAIDTVGRSYALAVVGSARSQVGAYFEYPARRLESIGRMTRMPGYTLPNDDPSVWGVLNRTTEHLAGYLFETLESSHMIHVLFDDGSRATASRRDPVISRAMLAARFITNHTIACCSRRALIEHYIANVG